MFLLSLFFFYSLPWIYHNFTFSSFKCSLLNKLSWCHITTFLLLKFNTFLSLSLRVFTCVFVSVFLFRLEHIFSIFCGFISILKQKATWNEILNFKLSPSYRFVLKTACFAQFGKLSQLIRIKKVSCSLTVCFPLSPHLSKKSVGSQFFSTAPPPQWIFTLISLKHINIHMPKWVRRLNTHQHKYPFTLDPFLSCLGASFFIYLKIVGW